MPKDKYYINTVEDMADLFRDLPPTTRLMDERTGEGYVLEVVTRGEYFQIPMDPNASEPIVIIRSLADEYK